MFNSYRFTSNPNIKTNVNNTLKINACSGGIYKTYKESWFKRFNLNSDLAEKLFKPYDNKMQVSRDTDTWDREVGKIITRSGEKEPVIILQMVICGDMEVIAELIAEKDFNKYFENKEVNKNDN